MNQTARKSAIAGGRAIVLALLVLAAVGLTNNVGIARAAEAPAADATLFDRLDADHDGKLTAAEIPTENGPLFARLLRRADANHDSSLTRDEFLAGLVPSRPEKTLEPKQPATFPQADAVRYLLLSMDTNGNSLIEADEVPEKLRPVFKAMSERLDTNKNGRLERNELSRGGPPMAQIAGRYVQSNSIDVAAELKKLEEKLGLAADRFEQQRMPLENLSDPKRAREMFVQLDSNSDGQIEQKEIPRPLERPFERLMRMADRDDDGKLSEREFLAGVRRIAERQGRPADGEKPAAMRADDAKPKAKATPDSAPAGKP